MGRADGSAKRACVSTRHLYSRHAAGEKYRSPCELRLHPDESKDVAQLYEQVPLGAVVQIIPDRLPKMEKAKPRQETSNVVIAAKVMPHPRQETSNGVVAAEITPQPPAQISAATLATPPSRAAHSTVEQMRMAGALAGERKKAKLASSNEVRAHTRLLMSCTRVHMLLIKL